VKIGISFGQFLGSLFRSKEREKGVELKKLTKPEAAQLAKERKRLKRQYRAASTRRGRSARPRPPASASPGACAAAPTRAAGT